MSFKSILSLGDNGVARLKLQGELEASGASENVSQTIALARLAKGVILLPEYDAQRIEK